MCNSIIFGAILILIGLSIVVGFSLGPIIRIAIALGFVYLGLSLIMGSSFKKSSWYCGKKLCGAKTGCTSFMGKTNIKLDSEAIPCDQPFDYGIVFGRMKLDFADLTENDIKSICVPLDITVSTVFGTTEIIINKEIPTRIISQGAFSKTIFPDNNEITFGSYTYNSHPDENPMIIIRTNTVFGTLEVMHK